MKVHRAERFVSIILDEWTGIDYYYESPDWLGDF